MPPAGGHALLNMVDGDVNAPSPPECPPPESLPNPAHHLLKPAMSAGSAQIHAGKVDLHQQVSLGEEKKSLATLNSEGELTRR